MDSTHSLEQQHDDYWDIKDWMDEEHLGDKLRLRGIKDMLRTNGITSTHKVGWVGYLRKGGGAIRGERQRREEEGGAAGNARERVGECDARRRRSRAWRGHRSKERRLSAAAAAVVRGAIRRAVVRQNSGPVIGGGISGGGRGGKSSGDGCGIRPPRGSGVEGGERGGTNSRSGYIFKEFRSFNCYYFMSKGFAFIRYATPEQARKVLADLKDGTYTLYMGNICNTWTREQIAEQVEFFSFGTNDLTQMTFGYGEMMLESFFLYTYPKEFSQHDPFEVRSRLVIDNHETMERKYGSIGDLGVEDIIRAGLSPQEAQAFHESLGRAVDGAGVADPKETWRAIAESRLLDPHRHPHSLHQLIYYSVYSSIPNPIDDALPLYWFPSP
ncbi:hypothetical protein Syun_001495 [Stephania yunnanensis]|uniref:PEP-utilising enzyme C-terminal domain-containing protein n=1 Tax=Stephania yunnanensis TaxID=152371 RepID=A0AAP0LEU9_9MAGN